MCDTQTTHARHLCDTCTTPTQHLYDTRIRRLLDIRQGASVEWKLELERRTPRAGVVALPKHRPSGNTPGESAHASLDFFSVGNIFLLLERAEKRQRCPTTFERTFTEEAYRMVVSNQCMTCTTVVALRDAPQKTHKLLAALSPRPPGKTLKV